MGLTRDQRHWALLPRIQEGAVPLVHFFRRDESNARQVHLSRIPVEALL